MVHDCDSVAQAVGFVHVVGRNEDGELPVLFDVGQHFPHGHTGNRIEPGGRLIEKENTRAVYQSPGDLQAPAHATRKSFSLGPAPLGQIYNFEQFVNCLFPLPCGHIVKLGVDVQVFFDCEIEITGQRLRDYANGTANRIRLLLHIMSSDARRACGNRDQRRHHTDEGRFAGAVRPQ